MNFQADGDTNLYIISMDNPQFSTQLSNSDDISYFTSIKKIRLSILVESNSIKIEFTVYIGFE